MGNLDDIPKAQRVPLAALELKKHNLSREKYFCRFKEKHRELRHALVEPDVDLQEVTRLVEEMAECCREISFGSERASEFVVDVVGELIPQNEIAILDEMAVSIASKQYSDWESKKKSLSEDSTPTSSSVSALSTSKEDEASLSIASEEVENLQPGAESTSSTDEREEKESTATVRVPDHDNQEGEKTEGRWLNINNALRAVGILPRLAQGVNREEEAPSDFEDSSNNFDVAESQETDIATVDKPDDSFDTAATVSVASEDLLPTSENTTAPPVVNSVSEDPTVDICEAAVESAAASEEEEASSAAATEATAKPTAASDSEDLTVDISAFDSLINTSGDNLFAETKLPILRLVQVNIGLSFKSEKELYPNIKDLATHFVSVLIMHPVLSKAFGAYLRDEYEKETSELESGVPVQRGFGSIMSSCEKKTSETEDDDQSNAVPDVVIEIKTAIYAAENGNSDIKETIFRKRHGDTFGVSRETIDEEVTDEDVKSFINDGVTNTSVKEHLLMGRQTNSLLMHVLNLFFASHFLWELSIYQVFEHFTKAPDLIAKLREFAQRANRGGAFDVNMRAIHYLETFVAPSLRKEEPSAAWDIACTVFNYLNKFEAVGPKAKAEKRANDPRKRSLVLLARTFERQTIYGATDDSAIVFWSGTNDTHRERRLRAFRKFAVHFLRAAIEESLEPGFFSSFGFTRCFLRLPPSGMAQYTTFLTTKFFSEQEQEKYGKKFDDIIKKAKNKEGEDTGERTLFVQGDRQRESLRALREMFVALSPSPAGSSIEV